MSVMPEFMKKVSEEIKELPEGMDRLNYLVELGKELGAFPEELKIEENKVPGCISGVYIIEEIDDQGKINFRGCSNSFIVAGYVKILVKSFSGYGPKQFLTDAESQVEEFIKETKINVSLVQSRANAFANIFKFMQQRAAQHLS